METQEHGFQKVNPYSQHLPYAEFIEEEAAQMLEDIISNLSAAVLQREIRPGVVYWLTKLDYYVRIYDQRFTKQQHIHFIKLLYALLAQPCLSYNVIEMCCRLLTDLLRKIKRLSRDDLLLDWRPLYEMVDRMCFCKKNRAGTLHVPTSKTVNRIWMCVRKCRIYFSVESTREMMDEFRPLLCPSDVVCMDALSLLSNFLPILLPPEHHDQGFKLWFEELIELWLSIPRYDSRSSSLMHLFTNLAEVNIGYIDWTPYIPRLFNVFLRGFRLPPFVRHHKESSISADWTARFIISMLGGEGRVAMDHFRKLMLTLKNFYHPSNAGSFQLNLQRFLCLAKYYCIRFHKERITSPSWYPPVPESHRLSDDCVTEFCQILRPIVEVSMFSRFGSMETAKLLRDLVMLRPEIFIPVVLEKSYAALETLNEPHQILNVMPCLSVVARALLTGGRAKLTPDDIMRYPEGPTHLFPVLRCLLPGIDPNDFSKTVLTATVFSAFASLMPIVDCSELLASGQELTETQRVICEASSQWEDFLLQLLDRCFCVFEQLSVTPDVAGSRTSATLDDSSQEAMMGAKLSTSMLHILQQCSPSLFEVACKRMFSFATSCVLEPKVAGAAFGDMLENACQVNPGLVWRTFFPHCHQAIIQLAADGDPNSDKADHGLIWNLQLVTALSNGVDETVLQYKDEIVNLLNHTVHFKNRETYNMAGDFLAGLLASITTLFATEKRSTEQDYSAPPLERDYLKDWGAGMHIDDLCVRWHVPNAEELDFAGQLLEQFLDPEMKKLRDLVDGKCEMDKEEFHRRLYLVNACLEGASAILPDIGIGQEVIDPATLQISSCVPLKVQLFRSTCPSQDEASAKHSHRRLEAANLCHQVLDYILKAREDDTMGMSYLLACYCVLVSDQGCPREKLDARQLYNDSRSIIFFDRITGKKNRPRSVLIDRVELQHLKRVISRYTMPVTVAHIAILDRVVQLSLSRYTTVRIAAQQILPIFAYQFYGSIRHSLPAVLDCLQQSDSYIHEQLKGALFILNMEPFLRFMSGRYRDMLLILPKLLQADHSEKPSIATLVKSIIRQLLVQGNYPSLKEKMSDECISVAKEIAASANLTGVDAMVAKGKDLEDAVSREHQQAFSDLISSLVQILNAEKVRLTHLQFCGGVLSALIRSDVPLPASAIKVFADGLVNEVLLFRRLSWGTLTIILRQLRVPTDKITFTAAELISGGKTGEEGAKPTPSNSASNFPPGLRADNRWICYDPENLPTTKETWESFQFVHKPHWGFAGWPRTLRLYAPASQQSSLANHLNDLSEGETLIRDAFLSEDFVAKLVHFFSQEVLKGRDVFDMGRFSLFKALFRSYLDTFVAILRPYVEELAVSPQDNNQRCAAEIIAGMLSSCRHWSFDKIEALKEWLVPLLKTVFQKLSVDTSRDWLTCISCAVGDRDPRSLYWLYELLFSCQMTAEGGSYGDACRLGLLERAVCETEWKAPLLLHRVNSVLQHHFANPYQLIRRSVAGVLASCVLRYDNRMMQLEFPGQVPLCKDFLAHVMPGMEILLQPDDTESVAAGSNDSSRSTNSPQLPKSGQAGIDSDEPQDAAAAAIRMIAMTQQQASGNADVISSLPPQIVEFLKQAGISDPAAAVAAFIEATNSQPPADGNGDQAEVVVASPASSESGAAGDEVDSAAVVPQEALGNPEETDEEVEAVEMDDSKEQRTVATRTFKTVCSWLATAYSDSLTEIYAPVLPLICSQEGKEHDPELSQVVSQAQQAMAFSLLHPGNFVSFLDSVAKALPELGWRGRKASLKFIKFVITTNLFTASVSEDDMKTTLTLVLMLLKDDQQEVRKEASGCLSAMVHVELVAVDEPLITHLKSLAATPLPKKRTLAQLAANFVPRNLVLRHAGTLGLCSLIRAFPYTVPHWMPDLLMVLDRHMADPAPIQGTVREALSEFKRTHHDNWSADKLAFSDEQLQVLTELLISPSYYV